MINHNCRVDNIHLGVLADGRAVKYCDASLLRPDGASISVGRFAFTPLSARVFRNRDLWKIIMSTSRWTKALKG